MNNYITQIKQYQKALINNIQSQVIKVVIEELIEIELSIEQLVYVTCVLNIRDSHQRRERGVEDIQIPVQYLFSLMTPFNSTDYQKNIFQEYMADVTKRCIIPLSILIKCSGYTKDHCRRFTIDSKLIDRMNNHIEDVLENNDYPLEILKPNITLGTKPAKWGGYCLKVQHLPTLTKTVWHKLKNSQFKFDIDLFNSLEGKIFNKSLNMNKHQRYSLIHAMSNMLMSNESQYHDSFYIQNSGRLHTKGGPMNLNTTFRRKYIKPINPSNYILEVDLKCAQLLALCDLLGANDVKEGIITLTQKDSIWRYIGNPLLPKELKKVIVYGFCFGANLDDLPYLATYRGSIKHNFNNSITKEDVNDCFSGILNPLIELRDIWMNQYTIPNITSGNINKVIHTNALGLKFNINNELNLYKKELKSKKQLNPLKIASRLLAFYSQAHEQLIIQSLLAQDCITNNIITYSYDGFSLETAQPEITLNTLQSYLCNNFYGWHLDYQVYK